MDFSFLRERVITGENQVYTDWIVSGMAYTAGISCASFVLAITIGLVVGTLKFWQQTEASSGKSVWATLLGRLAESYFQLVRSVPFVAQLFIWYFVVPALLLPNFIKTVNQHDFTVVIGTIALGVFMSTRIAAQVCAGLAALPSGQSRAARALGFSNLHAIRYFLLPQALQNISGTLTSEAMNTVKNSAVISTIGVLELTKQSQQIIDYTARPVEAFICVVLGYLAINASVLVLARLVAVMAARGQP